jgi:hypothetical protein
VIPALLPDIAPEHLVAATVRNYYFPILARRLVVEINDVEVSERTFESVCRSLSGELVPRSLLAFVRQLQAARTAAPTLILPAAWQREGISSEQLGADATEQLREQYKAGQLLVIRAPLEVKPKGSGAATTAIDLFLKLATPGERAQTLVVRGSITVPIEGKKVNLPDSHAALVATDDPISKLLGDAENPAHTQWNERAEKLRLGWERGHMVLRRVRAALNELYKLVAERIERDDPLAFLEFFSVPKSDRAGDTRPVVGRPSDLPPTTPRPFRIEKRAGGFAILPNGPEETGDQFPMRLKIRCAYDVLSGNPYKRFSEYDFSFYRGMFDINKENASCLPIQANELEIVARGQDFRVEVLGFDPNRDLIIEAQS